MSNKKQTAVEWLREQFHKVPFSQFGNLFEEAKEMEKEQIIEAYKEGDDHGFMATESYNVGEEAEHYYTQTYGE